MVRKREKYVLLRVLAGIVPARYAGAFGMCATVMSYGYSITGRQRVTVAEITRPRNLLNAGSVVNP